MARKSRFVAEIKEEKKTAMLLAGVYARLSIADGILLLIIFIFNR